MVKPVGSTPIRLQGSAVAAAAAAWWYPAAANIPPNAFMTSNPPFNGLYSETSESRPFLKYPEAEQMSMDMALL